MALPLNRYKSFPINYLSNTAQAVYTAPTGYVGVLLSAICANSGTSQGTFTLRVNRGGVRTNLVRDFPLPGNDSANVAAGKVVLEPEDQLEAVASSSDVHLTLSILETKI